jgi:hypothetical protein
MQPSLKGQGATSARRSRLARHWGISPRYVAPSTCMGPPLTESPGQCEVHERGHTGSPTGGQHSRVLREVRMLEGMTGTEARHQVPAE